MAEVTQTSGFGPRSDPITGKQQTHSGIDLAAPAGSPVVAPLGGTVIRAGSSTGGYGNVVEIQHDNGLVTRYAHNNRVFVKEGQTVGAGDAISEVGSTGRSTGNHLHFEAIQDGKNIDPKGFLSKLGVNLVGAQPMKNQATAPQEVAPNTAPSSTAMALNEFQNEAKYGGLVNQVKNIPQALSYGFQTQNSTYNFFVNQGMEQVDKELTYTKELVAEATAGIPEDNHGYILQGVNKEDIFKRRARVEQALKQQQELSNMGAVGTIGTAAGALLDLPTVVGFVPVLGEAAMVSKTSRIANALATGLVMAGTNVAADAAMLKQKPLGTTNDLYWSAAAGLAFGLPIGGMADTARAARFGAAEAEALSKYAQKEMNAVQKAEFQSAGLELTDRGKRVFDTEFRAQTVAQQEVETIKQESKQIPKYERPSSEFTEWVPTNSKGKKYEAGSTMEYLNKIVSGEDKINSALAKRILEQLPEDIPFYLVPKSSIKGALGRYYRDPHLIVVSREAPQTTQLHEIAHAMQVIKIEYGLANPNTVHGQLVAELDKAYKMALEEADKAGLKSYYLKNINEFAASLYGGSQAKPLVEMLSKVKLGEGETLLTKIVQTLRKLMGFGENETNLYLKSLDISDRLLDEKLLVNTQGKFEKRNRAFYSDPDMKDYMPDEKGANVGYTALGPALENFFTREWVNQEARDMFHALAGSTTGYKNHAVVKQSAWDQTLALGDGWATRLDKSYKPAFNEYFQELQKSGQVTRWQRGETFTKWEQQVGDYVRGIENDYHPSIVKVGNEIRPLLRDVLDHYNNPAKFNGGIKRGLTQIEEVDPVTGEKVLSSPLPYNENYLPRHLDTAKVNNMTAQFGEETVQKFLSNAFKSANPEASEKVAERFGRWYFRNLEEAKLNSLGNGTEALLRGVDRESFKDSLMKIGQMTEDEATEVLAALFPKKEKASPLVGNLKSRSSLDEKYTEQIMMPDGTVHTMSMNSLIDTRTFDVLENYFRRSAGAISMANQLDVYKAADLDSLIAKATAQKFGTAQDGYRTKAIRDNLQFTADRILGKPVEGFTPMNKSLQMWRDFNVNRLMGGAVFNQVQEVSQHVGSLGWKSLLRAIPELGAMVRDAKTGKVANEMVDQLENLTGGAGAELLRRTDFHPRDEWVREMGDTPFNQWLDKLDTGLNRSSQAILKMTGMTGLMVQQKRVHAIAMVNHFVEAANGKVALGFNADRLAWMGLSPEDTAKVLEGIKANHKDVKGSKIGMVDFVKWQQEDPSTYSKFIVAFQRESRRVVQENDLASMIPVMGKGWGQTAFQFMNFSLQAWNKSLGFAMNHRDFQTLSTVLHGSMFAAATYVARTHAQMIGMSDEERMDFAEKRLSTKQIVANSVGRLAQVSILPVLIDSTIAPVPIFSGARTTSNVTDFVGSNPTLSAISALLQVPRKVLRAGYDSEYQISERDMQQFFKVLPFNNVIGISNLLNSVAADYPNSNIQE